MYYIVKTPKNPEFSGKVCGVQFSNGRAVVSNETLAPHLGYTVESVLAVMKGDFGYEVTPVGTEHEAILVTEKIYAGTGQLPVGGSASGTAANTSPVRNASKRRVKRAEDSNPSA